MREFMVYSAGMLKTFEHCKKKFEYKYIKNISTPINSEKMDIGKNIHALANYYLKNENIEKLETSLTAKEKELWENLKNNKYFNYEIVKSEYNLTSKIEKYWINGRLDALVKKDNKYYILDYKTGSIPKNPEKDYQTIIYLLMIDKILNGKYEKLSFIYIDLKNNTNKKIEFNNEVRIKYKKQIITILEDIEKSVKLTIFPRKSNTCSCEYDKLCIL